MSAMKTQPLPERSTPALLNLETALSARNKLFAIYQLAIGQALIARDANGTLKFGRKGLKIVKIATSTAQRALMITRLVVFKPIILKEKSSGERTERRSKDRTLGFVPPGTAGMFSNKRWFRLDNSR